ncbi:MAG: hypothetical protein WC828_05345 [Thermoleophilia bacterium]
MRSRTRLALVLFLASLFLVPAISSCDWYGSNERTYSFSQKEYATSVGVGVQLRVIEFLDEGLGKSQDFTPGAGGWTIDPDQGASVSANGLFTATKPGSYSVKAAVPSKDECSTTVVITGAAAEIFNNGNGRAIDGGGTPPSFEVAGQTRVTEVTTYHDTASTPGLQAGTITLRGEDGKIYGPFQSTGSNGQGGDANAYWIIKPDDVILPPGRYTIIDSDPRSFAQNAQSGGVGMAWISGSPAN